ncbi:hapless 2 [Wolffia australiana]
MEILSKSRLENCVKSSDADDLECSKKVVVDLAVPSGSSGGEAFIVAELVEAEENSTKKMQAIRSPPTITINKSAAYALYELTYIRDVPYKPEEYFVKTRKCEPDSSAKVLQICEGLRDENGRVLEVTEPICCPCGPRRRVPSSCGNVFDKLLKGKANTAHCVRFQGEWFHVFGIGRRTVGFSVRIKVQKGSTASEVVVGPENRTVLSEDKFLRVSLVGDYVGYTNIPSFEDFYLVMPRGVDSDPSKGSANNLSKWMLLERVRFTLDGLECNKIGVSYEAYREQPNFCSSPLWSCLHNQLSDFWEADQNRISRNQTPQYVIEGRFERINQHPNAGTHSFSIGISEVLNTNLLIELSADDIEYVYQKSPGKIVNVSIPTFEALTQFGIAKITAQNIGSLEASYGLTFQCVRGIIHTEEQFFIMKPGEFITRSFKLYPNTDQAARYECTAILKDSEFSEIDRAECQFTTTATVLDNGTQIVASYSQKKGGIKGFFEAVEGFWNSLWKGLGDFFTGKSCNKCDNFFDFACHLRYVCASWIGLLLLFLAIFPSVTVLLWLLHQKGFFDPVYDWWEGKRSGFHSPADDRVRRKKRRRREDHSHLRVGDGRQRRRYQQEREASWALDEDNGRRIRPARKVHKHKHGRRRKPR